MKTLIEIEQDLRRSVAGNPSSSLEFNRSAGRIIVKLYTTEIAIITRNTITLSMGEYRTKTSKRMIVDVLQACKIIGHVKEGNLTINKPDNSVALSKPFTNGIWITRKDFENENA